MSDERPIVSSGTPGDDWLERMLAADGAAHRDAYVADDGFTARVMAGLPAPATLPAWRRPVVVALWSVAATGIAVAMPGAVIEVAREAYRLLAAYPVSLSGMAGAAAAMLGLTAAAAAWTLRESD
ncbi:MAG: hypothetical protein U1F58_19580 [Burkholderiales bacterium]